MTNWQFTFTGNWPILPVMVLGVLAALLSWWLYRSRKHAVPRRVHACLCILRGVVIVAIALFLLHPVIRYTSAEQQGKPILVLLDTSESMGIQDTPQDRSRLDTALHLLRDAPYNLMDRLRRHHSVRLFTFGSGLREPRPGAGLTADAPATPIGDALENAVSRVGSRSVSNVILISDGVNTTGRPPQETARYLGIPIHTITVGGKTARRGRFLDIGISGPPSNTRFIVDNRTVLPVQLVHRGLGDWSESERTVTLSLRQDDEQLAVREITLPSEEGTTEVGLEYTPQNTGIHRLRLALPRLQDEKILQNNQRSFTVNVTNPRIRVLYVEGVVRAEYRFLRRALASDPNIKLTSVIKLTKDQFYQQGVDPGISLQQGLPTTEKGYKVFDVILMGNLRRQEFKRNQLDLLTQFVRKGGGLLVMGGQNAYGTGGWSGTPLSELLPVTIRDANSFSAGSFHPRLTPAGKAHPIFRGCAPFFTSGDTQVALGGMNEVSGIKDGATVLCIRPPTNAESVASPVVAVQRSGNGQVLALTANSTWKWRFHVEGDQLNSPYYRFWRQSLRWLKDPEKRRPPEDEATGLTAWTDSRRYDPGETVTIKAKLGNRSPTGKKAPAVRARIQFPRDVPTSGSEEDESARHSKTLSLRPIPMVPERYTTTFEPPVNGTYEATVTADIQGGSADPQRLRFAVGQTVSEFDRVDVDETTLHQTAAESGGTHHTIATATDIAGEIVSRSQNIIRRHELNLWNAPLFFIFVLSCLTVEWILRKHYGLS